MILVMLMITLGYAMEERNHKETSIEKIFSKCENFNGADQVYQQLMNNKENGEKYHACEQILLGTEMLQDSTTITEAARTKNDEFEAFIITYDDESKTTTISCIENCDYKGKEYWDNDFKWTFDGFFPHSIVLNMKLFEFQGIQRVCACQNGDKFEVQYKRVYGGILNERMNIRFESRAHYNNPRMANVVMALPQIKCGEISWFERAPEETIPIDTKMHLVREMTMPGSEVKRGQYTLLLKKKMLRQLLQLIKLYSNRASAYSMESNETLEHRLQKKVYTLEVEEFKINHENYFELLQFCRANGFDMPNPRCEKVDWKRKYIVNAFLQSKVQKETTDSHAAFSKN